ncbi:MAG: hypothetical protein LBF12_04450 [Christensenellaceae bacterium]|nr:hypothetical protein [Christensenellaceae bacterium]
MITNKRRRRKYNLYMIKWLYSIKNQILFKIKTNVKSAKKIVNSNRRHYVCCFISLIIAFFLALINSKSARAYNPIISQISNSDFNYILSITALISYTLIIYIPIILTSINYILFYIAGYGGIFIISHITIASMLHLFRDNIFHGVMNALLYLIPILTVNFILVCKALNDVYLERSYNAKQSRKSIHMCELRRYFGCFKKNILYSLVFNMAVWTLNVLLFTAIYA